MKDSNHLSLITWLPTGYHNLIYTLFNVHWKYQGLIGPHGINMHDYYNKARRVKRLTQMILVQPSEQTMSLLMVITSFRRNKEINKSVSISNTYPSFGLSISSVKVWTLLYEGPPHGGERNTASPWNKQNYEPCNND